MARKGQLSIGFYISLLIFLGALGYVAFQLFQKTPTVLSAINEESLRIEAYQISELVVNDAGEPDDWNERSLADVNRIGLSYGTGAAKNLISRSKINEFKTICGNNFDDIKSKLDITDRTSITIVDHEPAGDIAYVCQSSIPSSKENSFSISRTALAAGNSYPTEIIVEVWG